MRERVKYRGESWVFSGSSSSLERLALRVGVSGSFECRADDPGIGSPTEVSGTRAGGGEDKGARPREGVVGVGRAL